MRSLGAWDMTTARYLARDQNRKSWAVSPKDTPSQSKVPKPLARKTRKNTWCDAKKGSLVGSKNRAEKGIPTTLAYERVPQQLFCMAMFRSKEGLNRKQTWTKKNCQPFETSACMGSQGVEEAGGNMHW